MDHPKIGASRHNSRTAPKITPSVGSKTPQTPHHGGGGSPDSQSLNDLELDNHQSINHNHCPLDDCNLFTEHRYPVAIAEHIQFHFLFEQADDGLERYGPDIVNKTIALMKVKIVEEKFIPENVGAYFRSRCEKFLKGDNVSTGADREKRMNAIHEAQKNYVNPQRVQKNNGQEYLDEFERRRGGR